MNPLRGEASLEAGGKTYTLIFDINAICEAEAELEMDVDMLLAKYASGTSARLVRGLIWAALQQKHPCSIEEAGDIISKAGFPTAKAALERAMTAAFPAAEKGEEKNPRKRGRAGNG